LGRTYLLLTVDDIILSISSFLGCGGDITDIGASRGFCYGETDSLLASEKVW
jgi:hypothetical protein